jgi:hypothetical protein
MTSVYRGVDKTIGNMLLSKLISNKSVLTGWLANPNKHFLPIAKLPDDIQKTLKSDNDLLLLSNDTLIKQIKNHNDLSVNDFAKITGVIKNGTVLKDKGEAITIISDGYLLGMKKTIASENMLETFFKIENKKSKKRIAKAERKGEVIRKAVAE